MFNSTESLKNRDSLSRKYLETFNEMHSIYIDSIRYKADFIISKNKKEQIGFETFINIKELPEGKHLLKLKRLTKRKKDTLNFTNATIPFWHFKQ